MNSDTLPPNPFGEECCEHERETYKGSYKDYFFDDIPFLKTAIDYHTYIIVGRRGAGKTSLANFFEFQGKIKNSSCIDVNEPQVYTDVLSRITSNSTTSVDILTHKMLCVWEYVFWNMIFDHYKDDATSISAIALCSDNKQSPAHFIQKALHSFLDKFMNESAVDFATSVENYFKDIAFNKAKTAVLDISKKKPLIIAMDSLERYDVDSEFLMAATSALVQFSSQFNIAHASNGLHLKVFLSGEIVPSLKEQWITNVTKYFRKPLYLCWRPKDLVRLTSWRLSKYLKEHKLSNIALPSDIDWTSFKEVHSNIWEPFFGEKIVNRAKMEESTFPYLLRHTQLRPRQFVVLCNYIADKAIEDGNFPYFKNEDLVSQTWDVELELADEVISSYAKIYENIGYILDALTSMPAYFMGKELDRIAHKTASAWPNGVYSPDRFKRLIAELGIVGKVRHYDERTKIVKADFEYALRTRLYLPHDEYCVIHPMFFRKFHIKNTQEYLIYPFPDHPDFQELS